jgi:TolA-binding protein
VSSSPVDLRGTRSDEELLAAARQLPEAPLSEARREEMRTEFLATVRGLRSTKRVRALAARGKGRRLLMVASVLFAGAGFAAAAWRITARPATAIRRDASVGPSGETHRGAAGRGAPVGVEPIAATDAPPSPPLRAASDRQPEPRAVRRIGMAAPRASDSPAEVEIAFARGWSALRGGDFATAAEAFGDAASRRTESALSEDASFWRGVAFDRAGRFGEARRAFAEFLDRYPQSDRAGETAVMLGWLLMRAGDSAGATARFASALDDPGERVRRSAQAGLAAAGRRHAN